MLSIQKKLVEHTTLPNLDQSWKINLEISMNKKGLSKSQLINFSVEFFNISGTGSHRKFTENFFLLPLNECYNSQPLIKWSTVGPIMSDVDL